MLEKARMAIQIKKVNRINSDKNAWGNDQEKCILMAQLNLKKPMRISFINKSALKLT